MNAPVTLVTGSTPWADTIPPDPRMSDLRALIDSGDFDVLSLDVFDTLVWRTVPEPRDVFLQIGHVLRERGHLHSSSTIASFAAERARAEDRARRGAATREVTLEDIYARFPQGYLEGISIEDLPACEREVERALVHRHADVFALARHAQERGVRIALVSDTYFRADFIRTLTGIDADFVIVSCEHGLSKHQGLHRVLLQQSGVPAARILHVGDNKLADIDGPNVFGIARYWLRKFPAAFDTMVPRELPDPWTPRATMLSSPDAGITMLRGRAQHRALTPHARWGAGVLGPLLAGFGEWVTERCTAREIRTALCLMREGTLLKNILDIQNSGVVAHETYLSRYSALRASIFTGSAEEIAAFVQRPASQPAGEVLAQLGLGAHDVSGVLATDVLTRAQVQALVTHLAGDRRVRDRIVAESTRARARLLAHIAQSVSLHQAQTVAVIDLGYKGTIQARLQAIFEHEGLPLHTHGLYVVTSAEVYEAQTRGVRAEGWLAENGQPTAMAHTFIRSPEVFEQSLMADCGSTLGHHDDGSPVLGDNLVPATQRQQINEVQAGALLYARMWTEHRRGVDIPPAADVRALFQAMCIRAVARPLEEELHLFGDWQHDDNFGTSAVVSLAEPRDVHPWEAEHLSAHQLASLPHDKLYWPFAYAQAMSPAMGEAVAQIFLRTAPPEAFDASSAERPLVVYRDLGQGLREEDAEVSTVTPSNRQSVWHRVSHRYRGQGPEAFAFALAPPGDVLRIRGVALHAVEENGRQTHTYIATEDLHFAGFRHLHGLLWLAEADPALVVCATPAYATFHGVIHADVFFSVCGAA